MAATTPPPPPGPPPPGPFPGRPAPPRGSGGGTRLLGLLLVVPAGLTALVSLVIPTGQTIVKSFQEANLLGRDSRWVALENYERLQYDADLWPAVVFSLSMVLLPLVVALVVAPLLAGALDAGGTALRRAGRVLMSVPLVVFSPVALGLAWRIGQADEGYETVFGDFTDPSKAPMTMRLILTLGTFGAVCGAALIVFLAVLRGRQTGRRVLPVAAAVGVVVALAGIAAGLQAFTLVDVMTRGGPRRSTETLVLHQFLLSFSQFRIGPGAAGATLLGLALAVLGVLATLLVIAMRLRIELTPPDKAVPEPLRRRSGPGGKAVAVVALLAVLAVTVAGLWPWLASLFDSGDGPSPADARTYINTWVPTLLSALVSVGTAYLAALGIGGLRPLGRHSEWLLLLFAPWLFVGIAPLSITFYENAKDLELLDTFAALIPPILLSVPALLVLTLFCRAQSDRWRAMVAAGAPPAESFLRAVAGPALPLAALLGSTVAVLNAQGLLWPLLVGQRPEQWTAPVAVFSQQQAFSTRGLSVMPTTPIVMIVILLAALVAFQLLYLDRLAITSELLPIAAPPPAPAPPPGDLGPTAPSQEGGRDPDGD